MLKRHISGISKKLRPEAYRESSWYTRRYVRKTRSLLKKTFRGINQEANETQEMAVSFFKILEHNLKLNDRNEPPSKKEVESAIEQLKDVGRFSIFATISILPGGGLSLIGLELIARKFGIKSFTFIPSAFRKKMEQKKGKTKV